MHLDFTEDYNRIRSGGTGYYEQTRGLIEVSGTEAVQFLDGLITNDVKTLEDGTQMLAALPNAQGRLVAVIRVLRNGEKFIIETEESTHQKVFDNLFRFTFAGDFLVKDMSEGYRFFSIFDKSFIPITPPFVEFDVHSGTDYFIDIDDAEDFLTELENFDTVEISDELYEVLRIESGIPKYGVDMDETTIVPELGIDGLISYNKGCYIGQEIVARIHFRGHVARQLRGLELSEAHSVSEESDVELRTTDGKNAGRVTSVTFSPKLGSIIALGFVRYEFLPDGTELRVGESTATVRNLPFL